MKSLARRICVFSEKGSPKHNPGRRGGPPSHEGGPPLGQPILEPTAELANIADCQIDVPASDSWLRIAKQSADLVGLEVAEPREGIRSRRRGRGSVAW